MLGLRTDKRGDFGCDAVGISIFFRSVLQRICCQFFEIEGRMKTWTSNTSNRIAVNVR